jgi:hypothetical protein
MTVSQERLIEFRELRLEVVNIALRRYEGIYKDALWAPEELSLDPG